MLAVKENKQYKINEVDKDKYLVEGYDITDDNGNIIERSHKSKVSYEEYLKVKNELDSLKAAKEEHYIENMEEQQEEEKPKAVKTKISK